mmetsp:Transcript_37226/g.64319  ORF Transcript_37226/g.64319 Transcript_37226/m.64319 type:complete len:251 (-) Transcript_37226:1118-1870(-)
MEHRRCVLAGVRQNRTPHGLAASAATAAAVRGRTHAAVVGSRCALPDHTRGASPAAVAAAVGEAGCHRHCLRHLLVGCGGSASCHARQPLRDLHPPRPRFRYTSCLASRGRHHCKHRRRWAPRKTGNLRGRRVRCVGVAGPWHWSVRRHRCRSCPCRCCQVWGLTRLCPSHCHLMDRRRLVSSIPTWLPGSAPHWPPHHGCTARLQCWAGHYPPGASRSPHRGHPAPNCRADGPTPGPLRPHCWPPRRQW